MIITTSENIPNREVTEILGVVTGNVVLPEHDGRVMRGLAKPSALEGALEEYSGALSTARARAGQNMQREASNLNADAIVNVRYSTSQIPTRVTEVMVYGTAVKIR